MVHDAEVARYNFVLQHGAGWYVDPVSVVSDDDDGALGGRGGRTVILKSCFSEHYSQRDSNKSILKADYNIQAGGQKAWERFLWQTVISKRLPCRHRNNRRSLLKVSQ